MRTDEELAAAAVQVGLEIHRELGPGLLEGVYETVMTAEFRNAGIHVDRQKLVPIRYKEHHFDHGFRIDLLLDGKLIIEVKSVEKINPVHLKQLLTYLRLTNLRMGLLMNFGGALFKDGLQRVVNGPGPFAPSCLRVNKS